MIKTNYIYNYQINMGIEYSCYCCKLKTIINNPDQLKGWLIEGSRHPSIVTYYKYIFFCPKCSLVKKIIQ